MINLGLGANVAIGVEKIRGVRPSNLVPRVSLLPAVTVIWASPSFWHPRAQIPSDMGIPFQYGCRVFGIPRYPHPMPKILVIWVSPKHASRISREIRKIFERWIPKNKNVLEYVKSQCYPIGVFTKQKMSCFKKMLRKIRVRSIKGFPVLHR